jgi:hypothetical protein
MNVLLGLGIVFAVLYYSSRPKAEKQEWISPKAKRVFDTAPDPAKIAHAVREAPGHLSGEWALLAQRWKQYLGLKIQQYGKELAALRDKLGKATTSDEFAKWRSHIEIVERTRGQFREQLTTWQTSTPAIRETLIPKWWVARETGK